MTRFILFTSKSQFIVIVLIELALLAVNNSYTDSSIEGLLNKNETETIAFCSMCETLPDCWSNGLRWWISQKDKPTIYQNYISILLPRNKNESCKIQIQNQNEEIEDVLIVNADIKTGHGVNDIWSFNLLSKTSQNLTEVRSSAQIKINRKTDVRGRFLTVT